MYKFLDTKQKILQLCGKQVIDIHVQHISLELYMLLIVFSECGSNNTYHVHCIVSFLRFRSGSIQGHCDLRIAVFSNCDVS